MLILLDSLLMAALAPRGCGVANCYDCAAQHSTNSSFRHPKRAGPASRAAVLFVPAKHGAVKASCQFSGRSFHIGIIETMGRQGRTKI